MKDTADLIERIKTQYSEEYNSKGDVSDEDIAILIDHDCECDNCGESIFELDDFPEIDIENDEVLCEQCHSDKYRETCPICEESYFLSDSDQKIFIVTENVAKELRMIAGFYEVIKYPFFLANIVSGFENFFDDSIRLIAPLRINELKKVRISDSCCEVYSDFICPDCESKYIRKSNFFNSQHRPLLLYKRRSAEFFKDYTEQQLHKSRQRLIHKRIYERGVIQQANNYKPCSKENSN